MQKEGSNRPARDVVHELLMASALAPLYNSSWRLEIDGMVTASDASEAAGAVCATTGLSPEGETFVVTSGRVDYQPSEESLGLVVLGILWAVLAELWISCTARWHGPGLYVLRMRVDG